MKSTVVALATIFVLTGCTVGTDGEFPQEPTTTAPTEALEPPSETQEAPSDPSTKPGGSQGSSQENFLSVVRNRYPTLNTLPDQTIIGLAKTACLAFDTGVSTRRIFMIIVENGVPAKMGGFIIGAGVVAYCPEHLDRVS